MHGIAVAGGVVFFCLLRGPSIVGEELRPAYASAQGKVETVSTERHNAKHGHYWAPKVVYSFDVDGRACHGSDLCEHQLDQPAFYVRSQETAGNQFKIGAPVQVRYDPSDPDHCYLVVPGMQKQYVTRLVFWFVVVWNALALWALTRQVVLFFRQRSN
jgi:hypothetical protein